MVIGGCVVVNAKTKSTIIVVSILPETDPEHCSWCKVEEIDEWHISIRTRVVIAFNKCQRTTCSRINSHTTVGHGSLIAIKNDIAGGWNSYGKPNIASAITSTARRSRSRGCS